MYYMDKCLRWLTGSLNYYQHFHLNIFPTAQCTIQIIIHRDRINRLVYAVEKQWMQNYLQQFPTSWFYLKFGSDVRTKLRNRKVIFNLIFWLFSEQSIQFSLILRFASEISIECSRIIIYLKLLLKFFCIICL